MKTQIRDELSHVQARDLMRKDVVTLAPEDSIETALQYFEEAHIGGAPVIDSVGNLIGVLTLSDIARPEHLAGDRLQTQTGEFEVAEQPGEEEEGDDADLEEIFFAKENYSPETVGSERVSDWMASEVISVRPNAGLAEICEVLVNQGIHRVFVTEGRSLKGVVSTTDIVRFVGRALRPRR